MLGPLLDLPALIGMLERELAVLQERAEASRALIAGSPERPPSRCGRPLTAGAAVCAPNGEIDLVLAS